MTYVHVWYLAEYFLEWETFKKKSCRENLRKTTLFMLNNFSPENIAVYEIMWKNMVQPDRQQMTI
jgi:hypothetical protein